MRKPCPVDIMLQASLDANEDESGPIAIIGNRSTLGEELRDKGKVSQPLDIMIHICHGSQIHSAFDSERGYKRAEWFEVEGKPLVYAHSCYSALILSRPEWANKFSRWVGSTDQLWFSAMGQSLKIWPDFFAILQLKLAQSQPRVSLVALIREACREAAGRLDASLDEQSTYLAFMLRNVKMLVQN